MQVRARAVSVTRSPGASRVQAQLKRRLAAEQTLNNAFKSGLTNHIVSQLLRWFDMISHNPSLPGTSFSYSWKRFSRIYTSLLFFWFFSSLGKIVKSCANRSSFHPMRAMGPRLDHVRPDFVLSRHWKSFDSTYLFALWKKSKPVFGSIFRPSRPPSASWGHGMISSRCRVLRTCELYRMRYFLSFYVA